MANIKINLALFILLSIFTAGYVSAADIYVDASGANTEENGSEANPYHSISAALVKANNNPESSRQISVKSGNYQEEIVLPENTTLSGVSRDTVLINRENLEGTTVIMGKNSIIENVTIAGGNYGLVVPEHKKATIRNCVVEKTKRIGIWIKRSNKLKINGVDIWDSKIENNSKKGLYSETRFIYFINNRFENNGEEGVDLRSKINGAVSNNTIANNREGGIEVEIRQIALEISYNILTLNRSNGITLNNRTHVGGKLIIKNNTITDNFHYGIRCTGTKKWSRKLWRSSIKNKDNALARNVRKNISVSCNSK